MRLLLLTFLLLLGVAAGWWLRGLSTPAGTTDPETFLQNLTGTGVDAVPAVVRAAIDEGVDRRFVDPETDIETTVSALRFRQLLDRREFDQAISYYQWALDLGEGNRVLLRPVLEEYLKACLQACSEGVFITLVDAWLASYYEDIPVLLLLAQYQQLQGFPEEAVKVLHMANTYAYLANQRELVAVALRRLVNSTDDYLSGQQRWIELLGFYELLEAIDLTEPAFLFRQAMMYRILGEPERTRSMLLALRASDNELDPQWTQAIELQLAEVAPAPEPEYAPLNAVPVTRHGDHYLIETTLNNRQQVVLMIDTGASITSIARESFDRLGSAQFERRGARLFNTANGIAQGEVYRAASITLGDASIDGIDVAVLDYEPPAGVDGLLGMNVLRSFRFEIDQDKALLYLRPR